MNKKKKTKNNRNRKLKISKRRIKKSVKLSKKLKKKYKIKDVPVSRHMNKGTMASSNVIDYHYQAYENITDFLKNTYTAKLI